MMKVINGTVLLIIISTFMSYKVMYYEFVKQIKA